MGAGFRILAKSAGEAEILIYEDVGEGFFGGVSAKQFAGELKALGDVATINLRINSYGGDVFDGLAIYRQLADHKAKIIVHIDGVAASIASVIAMAGDDIRIAEAGFIMIHDAWGLAIGTAADMREVADRLDTITGAIGDVYSARTKRKADDVRKWMADEKWFTATEALDSGFATEIVENMRAAARLDPGKHKFRNVPSSLSAWSAQSSAPDARLWRMTARLARANLQKSRGIAAA